LITLEEIREEWLRRGYSIEELEESELWKLPEYMKIADIDDQYVKDLSDRDLVSLYRYLHNVAKSQGVNEDLVNANVFVSLELDARGLYDRYKISDKLTEVSEFEVVEYPPAELRSDREVTIEELYDAAPNTIVIEDEPYAVYCVGRISNEGKIPVGHDIDWLFRQGFDPRVFRALSKIKPEWLRRSIHAFFDPLGPLVGTSYPLYRYGFFKVSKEEFEHGYGPYRHGLAGLKPFTKIRLLKQASGWNRTEFKDFQLFYDNWASKYLQYGIYVSKKYDGRSFAVHKQGSRVMIQTEDQMRDRADQMPNVCDELVSKVDHDLILHAEAVCYDCKGKKVKSAKLKEYTCEEIPREDTAIITVGNITPEWESSLVFHAHDLMYLDGKDLTGETYEYRFQLLKKTIPDTLEYFRVVESSPKITTVGDLKRWVDKLRRMKGSEGVYCRVATAKYPVVTKRENRTQYHAKIKNLKPVYAMAWKCIPKVSKEGKELDTFMVESYIEIPKEVVEQFRSEQVVEWKGRYYVRIGRTFGRAVKPKRGDIIEVWVGRVREYHDPKTGKISISWMFPKFLKIRKDKDRPDSLKEIRRIAKVGPGYLERLSRLVLRLPICPFSEEDFCPLRKVFGRPRYLELNDLPLVERLKFPVNCPIAYIRRCVYLKNYYYDFYELKYPTLVEVEED